MIKLHAKGQISDESQCHMKRGWGDRTLCKGTVKWYIAKLSEKIYV